MNVCYQLYQSFALTQVKWCIREGLMVHIEGTTAHAPAATPPSALKRTHYHTPQHTYINCHTPLHTCTNCHTPLCTQAHTLPHPLPHPPALKHTHFHTRCHTPLHSSTHTTTPAVCVYVQWYIYIYKLINNEILIDNSGINKAILNIFFNSEVICLYDWVYVQWYIYYCRALCCSIIYCTVRMWMVIYCRTGCAMI